MNKDDISQLKEELLTCHICEGQAFQGGADFHMLPCACQHTICEKCLTDLVQQKRGHQPIQCPWCRQEITLPESGKLPTFRYAAELCERLKLKNSSRPTRSRAVKTPVCKYEAVCFRRYDISHLGWFRFCWGESGKLYILGCEGLFWVNVFGNRSVHKFGHFTSSYSDLMFMSGELYAYNNDQKRVEVYQDEQITRSWKVSFNLYDSIRIVAYPASGISLRNKKGELEQFTTTGEKISQDVRRRSLDMLGDRANCILSMYNGSAWLLSNTDRQLWEIPMCGSTEQAVANPKRIKHCKLEGDYCLLSKWGDHKVIYSLRNAQSLKVLDLSLVSECHRVEGRSKRVCKGSILLSDAAVVNAKVWASEDGNLAVLQEENQVLRVYKITENSSTTESLTLPLYLEDRVPSSWCLTERNRELLMWIFLLSYIFWLVPKYAGYAFVIMCISLLSNQ